MGETATFRFEDTVGLLVAVGLHALLAAVLVLQMFFTPDPFVPPQRVTVSLATDKQPAKPGKLAICKG